MGTFRMNTGDVHTAAVRISENAEDFGYNLRRIKDIVEGIVSSEYTSPEAKDIADEVRRHEPALNAMHQTLENYGKYGIYASNLTEKTSEDISSMI